MDTIKWWMIMAQTHDGSYVVMPGRDYASTDHVYATRNFPTACAALILSLKEKSLRITGREAGGSAERGVTRVPVPAARPARAIGEESRAELEQMTYVALLELSNSGQLVPLPMDLSKARAKVWLSRVEQGKKFEFSALQGSDKAVFTWDELNARDHAMLAAVVARLRRGDKTSQAVAGIYMELAGDTHMADRYYQSAGPDLAATIDSIFQ